MKNYKVIDLFAGAGGLSYGFEEAGYEVKLAVERDSWAVETYKSNHRNTAILEEDISKLNNVFFGKYAGIIDVIVGGPPCQGFSIAASNRRKNDDLRNTLYQEFLRVVSVVKPTVVLMENVKEITKFKLPDGKLILADIVTFLERLGYIHDHAILNCRRYGIPQDRKRFFLIAVKGMHNIETLNLIHQMEQFTQPELTFNDAVSDLPEVRARQYPEDTILQYKSKPANDYQAYLRGDSSEIHNHIPMQHTDKTVKKFEHLLGSQGTPLPDELLPRVRGDVKTISDAFYGQNSRIINGDRVSPTITASFYSSFIHPLQPRNITVREAARIQTFPDSFVFKGKKTTLSKKLLARKGINEELHLDQFNQVGNAVPPLLAKHLALICKMFLTNKENGDEIS